MLDISVAANRAPAIPRFRARPAPMTAIRKAGFSEGHVSALHTKANAHHRMADELFAVAHETDDFQKAILARRERGIARRLRLEADKIAKGL